MKSCCKDCVAEWADAFDWASVQRTRPTGPKLLTAYLYDVGPSKRRLAPNPGPRCATHHREFKKKQKAERHNKYVARTYSLEEKEYGTLYEGQGGTCAICNRATGATRKLSVDHDHACCSGGVSCGYCVRGLLCRPCNDMLGHGRDDWRFFARAIGYLLKPPAIAILKKKRPDVHDQRAIDTRVMGGPQPPSAAYDTDAYGDSPEVPGQ